jgi:signal transduction histidine kinase
MLPWTDERGGFSGYDGCMDSIAASIATRPRLSARAQDALLGVLVATFQVLALRRIASADELAALAHPARVGYALLVVSGLVLVARRRFPVAVFAATAAASIAYYVIGYPDGPGWIGLFVAIYTVTAQGDGRRSMNLAGAGILGLTVVWLLTAQLTPVDAAGWVFFRIGIAVTSAVAGDMIRGRRILLAESQERAERAERTKEEEARRRVDAERLRIAREVHDTVAHAIAVINVQAGVTAHVLDRRPEQARETLVTIEQTSARALDELRATLGVLRSAHGDGGAPAPGLAQVDELAGLAREAGLDVKIEGGLPPRELPASVDQAAYRIVQESLTNAIRHAGPARVTISIVHGPGDLELEVADDGRGCPVGATPAGGGRGIVGMRERATLLGGELTAGPRPDGGFSVRARLPLAPLPPLPPLPPLLPPSPTPGARKAERT